MQLQLLLRAQRRLRHWHRRRAGARAWPWPNINARWHFTSQNLMKGRVFYFANPPFILRCEPMELAKCFVAPPVYQTDRLFRLFCLAFCLFVGTAVAQSTNKQLDLRCEFGVLFPGLSGRFRFGLCV